MNRTALSTTLRNSWFILLAVVLCCPGCRSLRSVRQTRELSAARQRSLRGADALQQQKFDEAEALFADALRRSPADERAQWGMAEVLWQRDQHETAIEHMEQAAQISGENPELLVRLGDMHLQEGRLDDALRYADQALLGDRQHGDAWALRGRVLRRRQELNEAMQCYHRALICRPNFPAAQMELSEVYCELRRPQRALATLDRMVDAQTDGEVPARAWMLRGQALADLGQRKDAQDCLRHAALCANDEESPLLIELAQTQFELGHLAEARLCLGRAMQRDPHNAQALAIQAELDRRFDSYANQNRIEPAISAQPAGWARPPMPQ
ncbi:MAG: tetratricopeptide repeat protein [Pirellulaceae bacterium]